MAGRNTLQKPNPQSYSQSDPSQTQAEVHELESPPPSYEAAVIDTDDRNQGRQVQSHNVNEPAGEVHFLSQQQGHRQQLEQQRQQLEQQLEQQRQQRELQRQQQRQQLEQQRHQRQQQQQQQQQQLQLQLQLHQQQQQQQPYPIQEYSSSNHHYQPDAKYPNTRQQDYYDLEAQQPTVASSSGIHTSISGQVQTDPRDRRGHRRGGCQHEDGKQRSGNCCVACFGGCLAGCAACCYCCVVM